MGAARTQQIVSTRIMTTLAGWVQGGSLMRKPWRRDGEPRRLAYGRTLHCAAHLLCSATAFLSLYSGRRSDSVAGSSLAGDWSSGISCCDGCGVRDVQRGGGVAAARACGDVEQRMVSAVGVCGDQLYEELDLRVLCGAGFVGWGVRVDDAATQ